MKKKWSLIYLNDLTQLQTWLEDQAAQGWYLAGCHLGSIAVFRREERRAVRYRLEPIDRPPAQVPAAERRAFYAEAGWAYVDTILGLYDVYAAGDPAARDLYTDADTLRTAVQVQARRAAQTALLPLKGLGALAVGVLALLVFYWSGALSARSLLEMGSDLHYQYWCLVLLVWTLIGLRGLADLVIARRQIRRLEREGLESYRVYPKGPLARLGSLLRMRWVLWAALAAVVAGLLTGIGSRYATVPLEELPEGVCVPAGELFPGGEEGDITAFEKDASLFAAAHFRVYQEPLDADKRRRDVITNYYEARWEELAERALEEQLEAWRTQYGDREPVRIGTDRADEAWKLNWDSRWCVAVRQGRRLLLIEVR